MIREQKPSRRKWRGWKHRSKWDWILSTQDKNPIIPNPKELSLNQEEFIRIFGHNIKSKISESMSVAVPFTLKELKIISKLLKIKLKQTHSSL